jgi:ubiquinone/menaquinone biosynthesis C-methylase UbiE
MHLGNVELHEALIESLPLEDESVDVVISNGVIDLVPDKDAVFDEIDRVLRPGGRLQLADVVIHHEVSEDARKRIDLWTGLIAGAFLEGEHARLLVERAYTDIRRGELVDTYARSAFEDTRRKAVKYGAMGSTIRATKPAGR